MRQIETSFMNRFLTTLADRLAERANLQGVTVSSAMLTPAETGARSIALFNASSTQEWGMIGNQRRDEDFIVAGGVWVVVPGGGEAAIRVARADATELLAEIEECLRERGQDGRTEVGIQMLDERGNASAIHCGIVRADLDQGPTPAGRWCKILFDIGAKSTLPRR